MKITGQGIAATLSILFAWIGLTVLNLSESDNARTIAIACGVLAVVCLISSMAIVFISALRSWDKEHPKKSDDVSLRATTDIKQKDSIMCKNGFVAIDFEHLYSSHETACEVGAVKVVDGLVIGRFYSTIKPPVELCTGRDNSDIIGLTKEMLEHSLDFPSVYELLKVFVGDLPLVAHHASTEKHILNKCCTYYKIKEVLLTNGVIDTCELFGGKGLSDCCVEKNISLMEHHNPLQDAEATAKLYLSYLGVSEKVTVRGERLSEKKINKYKAEKENFDSTILQPLCDDDVQNKSTPFFGGVKTVVTGQYEAYPDRNLLKLNLKELGADVDTSVSKNTKILVTGKTGVGPSKLKKAKELGVRIVTEEELYQWVEKQI